MGADSVIYIRADGNTEIATGHLVRCLSIARALKKELQDTGMIVTGSGSSPITFLVSDQESKALLNGFFDCREEFPVRILETARYDDLEAELPELTSLIINRCQTSHCYTPASDGASYPVSNAPFSSLNKPVLLVDSYFVTENYFLSLKTHATLVYLDDLRSFDYPVDLVINYDILTPEAYREYEHSYTFARKRLLGGAYAPLRPQFQSASRALPSVSDNKICHVLIASGGSDPYHTTLHLTQYLLAECPPGYCFHLLLGSMNPDRQALCELADRQNLCASASPSAKASSVILHHGVTNMASLMQSCDLALSAAGTTLYELCAVGVPSASFIIADNQIASANAFAQNDAIPCLGDVRTNEESIKKEAAHWVTSMNPYVKNQAASARLLRYQNVSKRMQQLVDGNGAIRIADALLALLKSHS